MSDLNVRPISKLLNYKFYNSLKKYKYPTKHLSILVLEPFWHLICINFLQKCRLSIKFGAFLYKFVFSFVLI